MKDAKKDFELSEIKKQQYDLETKKQGVEIVDYQRYNNYRKRNVFLVFVIVLTWLTLGFMLGASFILNNYSCYFLG